MYVLGAIYPGIITICPVGYLSLVPWGKTVSVQVFGSYI